MLLLTDVSNELVDDIYLLRGRCRPIYAERLLDR